MPLMMKFSIPVDSGNLAARDGRMEKAIESVVNATNAEAAYFSMIDGKRGGYIFFEKMDQAQLTRVTASLMAALDAAIEMLPALSLGDLRHGLPN
jgi:hypothetical protein